MPVDRIRVEHFLRNERLRCGHERAVGRDLLLRQLRWMRSCRVGPVASNTRTSRGTPKQRHRILEIGVQQRLMFDQGESGPVSSQRRAKLPQPVEGSATSLR
jgi:hypothetical protein